MLAEARAQKLHSRTFASVWTLSLTSTPPHGETTNRRQWRSTLNIAVDAFGDLTCAWWTRP
jgi:hypothetical protein